MVSIRTFWFNTGGGLFAQTVYLSGSCGSQNKKGLCVISFLTAEDGSDRLPRNVVKKLPLLVAFSERIIFLYRINWLVVVRIHCLQFARNLVFSYYNFWYRESHSYRRSELKFVNQVWCWRIIFRDISPCVLVNTLVQNNSVGVSLRTVRSGNRIPVWGEICRTCPDRQWAQPSLLYTRYGFFPPRLKRPGCGVDHQPTHNAKVYSSGPSCFVLEWTLPFFILVNIYDSLKRVASTFSWIT